MKIKVWKQLDRSKPYFKMWQAKCACGKTWQFWFFGATLGYGLEHQRRHGYGN